MNYAPKKPAGFKPGHMKMADGGYRKGSKDGGRVSGPGGPVADKVPAMYSNGEYVLPADTAKHIEYKRLDAIKDATHTPAAAQRMGFVPGGMADGGVREWTTRLGAAPEFDPAAYAEKKPVIQAPNLELAQNRTPVGNEIAFQPSPEIKPVNAANAAKPGPQPIDATTSLGAAPGRAVVPVGQGRSFTPPYASPNANPSATIPVPSNTSPANSLAVIGGRSPALTADAGRSFTPPYGMSRDPNTIYQPPNTSPKSSGRELSVIPARNSNSTALVPVGQPRGFTPPYAEPPSMGAPANPSFATGTSPEAAAYKATIPAPIGGVKEAALGMAKGIIKGLGLGAAGFGAARAMSHIGENSTPAPAQARAPETQALIDQIPGGAGSTPTPAAQPYSWWTDTDTGRNVGNALNALGPMGGAISNSLRAGSGFARLAQAGGAVAGGMAMGGSGDYSTPAPAQAASAPQAKTTTAPDPLMESSSAGAGRGSVNPPLANSPAQEALQAAQAPAGNVGVTRQPNGVMEFSGKDITGPVSYTGTTGFKPGGFGVSTPGEPGDGRRVMEMNNRLADEMRATREGTGQGFVYRQAPGQDWQSRNDRRNLEVSAGSNTKSATRSAAISQLAAMDARDLQGERLASDAATATMQDATTRMGQRATAAQAGATNQLAQQRLGLDQQKLGMEQTAQGFQARGMQRLEAAQQALLDPKATPEQRKQAQSTLAALNGKTAADRMQVVNLPDTTDATGVKMGGGQALVRFREDGSVEQVPIGVQQAQAVATNSPTTQAEYDKLPKGAKYIKADGTSHIKG